MKIKKHFLTYIEQVEKIIDQKNLSQQDLATIKTDIDNAELIIPVVGGFSAGKSTLINSFLGQNLLLTKVTPETALATELRYNTEDYLEAVTVHDYVERHELTELANLRDNAKCYKFLRLFLNHNALKEIQPLVLVDMPGFDSPIENHNQAILNYLNKGTYFIFLTSIEDGNLTRSMVREIENIQLFEKDFSFGLSKTNLRSSSDIQSVKNQIEEQLSNYFDFQKEVILFDQNGGENLHKILTNINPETLFQSLFQQPLEDNYFQALEEINIQISTLRTSKSESEHAIESLQKSVQLVKRKKEQAIADIERKYSTQSVESIINKVSRDLNNNLESLINLAISNQDTFSREINEIIKGSLLDEVQRRFQEISGQVIEDLSFDLRQNLGNLEGFDFGNEFVDRLSTKINDLINKAHTSLQAMANMQEHNGKSTGIYRSVMTILGITTSIVSPIIEVVLIFLPDIINFFSKESQERKMRVEIKNKIIGDIIPQVKNKIRNQLPEALNSQIQNLITDISYQFSIQIEQKEKEITQAAKEKELNTETIEEKISALVENRQQLNMLANKYLFIGEKL